MNEMKFCKDCANKNEAEDSCRAAECINPVNGINMGSLCFDVRQYGQACGPEAKLFKPKAIDPGEGYRLLDQEKDQYQQGDEYWNLKFWQAPSVLELLPNVFYRRRITPKIAKCKTCGGDSIVTIHARSLPEITPCKTQLFSVECRTEDCFKGPKRTSELNAIDAWNAIMQ